MGLHTYFIVTKKLRGGQNLCLGDWGFVERLLFV